MAARFLRLAVAYKLDDIRGIQEDQARAHEVLLLPARARWLFVPNARNDDDGVDWLLPSWLSSDRDGRWGRWQIVADGGGGGGGEASPLTTKGDLHTFDTADAALAVGADGYVLKADSGQPTGLKWDPLSGSYSPPIPESDVSGLPTDLANLASADTAEASARATADSSEATTRAAADSSEASTRAAADALLVPKTTTITATSPLLIDATTSADLSANRTLSLKIANASLILASQVFGG